MALMMLSGNSMADYSGIESLKNGTYTFGLMFWSERVIACFWNRYVGVGDGLICLVER